MCGRAFHDSHHRRQRHRFNDAASFFTVVVAMIREAIAVLAQARHDLEAIVTRPVSQATGHDLKPMETNPNVPL